MYCNFFFGLTIGSIPFHVGALFWLCYISWFYLCKMLNRRSVCGFVSMCIYLVTLRTDEALNLLAWF